MRNSLSHRLQYAAPQVEVLEFCSIKETMQASSVLNIMAVTGADVTFEDSSSFDDFFKN